MLWNKSEPECLTDIPVSSSASIFQLCRLAQWWSIAAVRTPQLLPQTSLHQYTTLALVQTRTSAASHSTRTAPRRPIFNNLAIGLERTQPLSAIYSHTKHKERIVNKLTQLPRLQFNPFFAQGSPYPCPISHAQESAVPGTQADLSSTFKSLSVSPGLMFGKERKSRTYSTESLTRILIRTRRRKRREAECRNNSRELHRVQFSKRLVKKTTEQSTFSW